MTLDGSSAPWNRVISNLDKVFAMRLYPKEGIQRTTTDGVYFINRERNGFEASGIAYYSQFGNNDGQQPDTYIEVSNGSFAWWENGGEGILLSFLTCATFHILSLLFSSRDSRAWNSLLASDDHEFPSTHILLTNHSQPPLVEADMS
jgi:hypothetical protein